MRPRSVLDGFFTDDPDAIARAIASLHARTADAADRSHGQVTNRDALGGAGRYERGGVLCERISGRAPRSRARAARPPAQRTAASSARGAACCAAILASASGALATS